MDRKIVTNKLNLLCRDSRASKHQDKMNGLGCPSTTADCGRDRLEVGPLLHLVLSDTSSSKGDSREDGALIDKGLVVADDDGIV
jgi:hypothetical protein